MPPPPADGDGDGDQAALAPLSTAGLRALPPPAQGNRGPPGPGGWEGSYLPVLTDSVGGKKTYGSSQNARQRATNAFFKNGYI